MSVDKAALLTARFGVEEVEIPGVGTVKVRPLSRTEALEIKGVELDHGAMERKLLAWALLDPVLTEDEIGQWQASSPAGEMEIVTNAIIRLSGLTKDAPKDAMRSFRG